MTHSEGRFGISLPGTDIRHDMELARYADDRGIDSIWTSETRLATDAIVPLSAYASVTDRIKLGTAVIPMWTRSPTLIAQTFATLDLIAPGRLILGLGAWWDPLASRVGINQQRPVRAMRELTESLRQLFSLDGHVTYDGQYVHLDDVYLDHGGTRPHDVKIYLAAVGPQMLRLTGRLADGVVLNFNHPVEAIRKEVRQIEAAAESVGRNLADIDRVQLQTARITRNKKQALQDDKPFIAQYIAQQPHIEGPAGIDQDLVQRLRTIIKWPGNDTQYSEGAKLISDDLVDSLGCYGDLDEVRERLAEYRAAGVSMPIVSVDSKEAIDQITECLRA